LEENKEAKTMNARARAEHISFRAPSGTLATLEALFETDMKTQITNPPKSILKEMFIV
jgi:hypothetical protein